MTTYEIYCSLKKEKGVTDADVSKSTGIGKSTFSDWKSGRSKPKTEKMSKIADFFDVPYSYLAGISKDRSEGRKNHDKRILNEAAPTIARLESYDDVIKLGDVKVVEINDDITEIYSNGQGYRIVRGDAGTGKSNGLRKMVENALQKKEDKKEKLYDVALTQEEKELIILYRSGKYKELVNLIMEKI